MIEIILISLLVGTMVWAILIRRHRFHIHRHRGTDVPHVYRCSCGDTRSGNHIF